MDWALIEWEVAILQREYGMTKDEAEKKATEDWIAFDKAMKEGRQWQ